MLIDKKYNNFLSIDKIFVWNEIKVDIKMNVDVSINIEKVMYAEVFLKINSGGNNIYLKILLKNKPLS